MKVLRILLIGAAISLPHTAFGQAPTTDGQKIFIALKSLAGSWTGPVAVLPAKPSQSAEASARLGDSMRVTLRVVSRGNTLVHEMRGADKPDDPTKYDNPVTMIYLGEDGKLTLTHYCDAGNRPRMSARISDDGKVIDFDFLDVSGKYDRTGHMQHARFTFIDNDHHVEDWTYLMPNSMTATGHLELHRTPVVASR